MRKSLHPGGCRRKADLNRLDYLGRTLRYAVARWLLRRDLVLAKSNLLDLNFLCRPADAVGRHLYRRGALEPEYSRYLLQTLVLRAGDVAIDAGANIGWYSMLLDRLAAEGADVFAFEPDLYNRTLLERNIEVNRALHVHVVPCALGEHSGSARLYRYPGKNLGRHSLIELHEGLADGGEVRVTSLAEFWAAHGLGERALRFVKIDVEGYEIFVLRGMGELLQRCDLMLLEYSPAYMAKLGMPPAELVDLMSAAGLLPYVVTEDRCIALDRESLLASERQQNLLWRRASSQA